MQETQELQVQFLGREHPIGSRFRLLSSLVNPSRPLGTSLMAQLVKTLPEMWETWVRSLGQENPLEKGWQPSPVFLPEEFQGQRSLAGYSSWVQRVGHD